MKKSYRSMAMLAVAVAMLTLSGCAQRGMYQWGGYDAMLYNSYKNPEKSADLRLGLEKHIGKMELAQQKVAPGLYAELGTLYLQAGDAEKAVEMYTKERDAWPESRGLMDALITNVSKKDKPATPKAEDKS